MQLKQLPLSQLSARAQLQLNPQNILSDSHIYSTYLLKFLYCEGKRNQVSSRFYIVFEMIYC